MSLKEQQQIAQHCGEMFVSLRALLRDPEGTRRGTVFLQMAVSELMAKMTADLQMPREGEGPRGPRGDLVAWLYRVFASGVVDVYDDLMGHALSPEDVLEEDA